MEVLATFKFRECFPGIRNLLMAINHMLDSGSYHYNIKLIDPCDLQMSLFESETTHPTLMVNLPLAENTDSIELNTFITQFASDKKFRSHQPLKFFLYSKDDKSITFISGDYVDSFEYYVTNIEPTKIIHEYTFMLRKEATGFHDLLSAISQLLDQHDYRILSSLDKNNNRWLQIHIYFQKSVKPLLVISRRLLTLKKEDGKQVSKINFCSAHEAPIVFSSNDNSCIMVAIGQPTSLYRLHSLEMTLPFM